MNDGKIPSSADGSIPRQSMDCKIVVMSKLTDSETSRQVACLQTALVSETDFLWGHSSVSRATDLHSVGRERASRWFHHLGTCSKLKA